MVMQLSALPGAGPRCRTRELTIYAGIVHSNEDEISNEAVSHGRIYEHESSYYLGVA